MEFSTFLKLVGWLSGIGRTSRMETRVNLSLVIEQGPEEGGENAPGILLCTIISFKPLAKQRRKVVLIDLNTYQ